MRILVRDRVTLTKARRTVCWQKLQILHHDLPRQYREPDQEPLWDVGNRSRLDADVAALLGTAGSALSPREPHPPRRLCLAP